jgi:hypothetical protein
MSVREDLELNSNISLARFQKMRVEILKIEGDITFWGDSFFDSRVYRLEIDNLSSLFGFLQLSGGGALVIGVLSALSSAEASRGASVRVSRNIQYWMRDRPDGMGRFVAKFIGKQPMRHRVNDRRHDAQNMARLWNVRDDGACAKGTTEMGKREV